jgi:uncharacterized protein YwqG
MQNIEKVLEEYDLLHKKDEILKSAASSIGIKKEAIDEKDISIGSSKFGGLPDLPSHFVFPKYHNGYLTFLAQINLQETNHFDKNHLLPDTGILFFFYDVIEQPWGIDEEDKESFKILYFDGDVNELKRTSYPKITEDYFPLPSFKIAFMEYLSLPEDPIDLELNDEELDNFYEFRSEFMQSTEEASSNPMHYMLGEPYNVQNNVFEELIYYENEGQINWDSTEIDAKSKELVLLFQMDSDDDLDVMWGDAGMLYFCIEKQDLLHKRFNEVKFTLQCY